MDLLQPFGLMLITLKMGNLFGDHQEMLSALSLNR